MQKQGLELKQTQRLSPLQIQTIKLIELPVQELEQKIRSELEENPVLDDGPDPEKQQDDDQPKDISIDEIKDDGEIPAYNVSARQGRATYRVSETELRRWVAKRKAVGHCTDGKVKQWRGANA